MFCSNTRSISLPEKRPDIHRRRISLCATLLILGAVTGCIKFPEQYKVVPPGTWRGTIELTGGLPGTDAAFDERSAGLLPFNFEVAYLTPDSIEMTIVNGDERIVLHHITYGHRLDDGRDTIRIQLPGDDSYILASYEEDAIEGDWYYPSHLGNFGVPFRAYHGKAQRFDVLQVPPGADFTGAWECTFGIATSDTTAGALFLDQDGTSMMGSITRDTVKIDHLQGSVERDRIFLSRFSGDGAYLIEGKLLKDGTLIGTFRSGVRHKEYWAAQRR